MKKHLPWLAAAALALAGWLYAQQQGGAPAAGGVPFKPSEQIPPDVAVDFPADI
jgi:hypothetical protein